MLTISGPAPIVQSKVLNTLRAVEGAFVSTKELISAVYEDREDGGPEAASRNIMIAIHFLRRKGYPIISQKWRGYRFAPTFRQVSDLMEVTPSA